MSDLIIALVEVFDLKKAGLQRRLLPYLCFAALIVGAVLLFESYTSTFRLGRLQKASELVHQLQLIEASGTNHSAELSRARKALFEQAAQVIEAKPLSMEFIPSKLVLTMDSFFKFIAGASLWIVYGVFQLKKRKSRSGRHELLGIFSVALMSGAFATLLPAIWWPWFHILVQPFLFVAVLIVCLMPLAWMTALRSGFSSARKRAQKIACINNLKQIGVSARLWANEHQGGYPTNVASLEESIGHRRFFCCPADENTKYKIHAPGVSDSDVSKCFAVCPVHKLALFVDGSVLEVEDLEAK